MDTCYRQYYHMRCEIDHDDDLLSQYNKALQE